MALTFDIKANYEQITHLREEISRLQTELIRLDRNASPETIGKLETELSGLQRQLRQTAEATLSANEEISFTAQVLKTLGYKCDISTPAAQIASLTKVIQESGKEILTLEAGLSNLEKQRVDLLAVGDTKGVELVTKDIAEQNILLDEARAKVEDYKRALSTVEKINGFTPSQSTQKTPEYYSSETQYNEMKELQKTAQATRAELAQMLPSDERFNTLSEKLKTTEADLAAMRDKAADAAAKLGTHLGGKAAETSTRLYDLNNALRSETDTLEAMKQQLAETSAAHQRLTDTYDSALLQQQTQYTNELSEALKTSTDDLAAVKEELAAANAELQNLMQSGDTTAIAEQQAYVDELTASYNQEVEAVEEATQKYNAAAEALNRLSPPEYLQALENQRTKINEVSKGIERQEAVISALKEKLAEAQTEQERLWAQGDTSGVKTMEAEMQKYTAALQRNEAALASQRAVLSAANEEMQKLQAAGPAEQIAQSTAKVQAQTAAVNAQADKVRNLSAAQKDAEQQFNATSVQIDRQNSTFVKLLGGQQNYQQIMGMLPPQLKAAVSGIGGMTKAAMAFIATPLGAVIAAIALAVKALSTFFTESAEGQMTFAKGSAYLQGLLVPLKEIVISVGKGISKLFTDPKQAVIDFGKTIVDNVINRFKAVGRMGSAIVDIFRNFGDWDKMKESAKDLGNAYVDALTGVENTASKVADKMSEAASIADKMAKLAEREVKLRRDRSKYQIEEAKLDAKISEARLEMYSATDPAARLAATTKAQELITQKYAKQLQFAREEADIIKQRNALSTNNEQDYDAQYAAEARIASLEGAMKSEIASFARRGATASQEAKKILEKLRADNLKDELEQIEEGKDKKLLLLRQDYEERKKLILEKEKELAALNKAAANGEDVGLTSEQQTEIDNANELNDNKYTSALMDVMREEMQQQDEYLRQYGSFQERKLLLTKEYNKKIAQAQAEGNQWQAKSLEKERDSQLSQMDIEELKTSDLYAAAFDNLGNASNTTLSALLNQLETMKGKMAATLSPTELREYMNTLNSVSDEIDRRNPFAALKRNIEELQTAKAELTAANTELQIAQNEYNNYYDNSGNLRAEADTAKAAAAMQRLSLAHENATRSADKHSKAETKMRKSFADTQSQISNLINALESVGEAIGGIAGDTISAITSVGTLVLSCCDGVQKVAATGAQAISTVEKASVILAIISAAIQVTTKLLDLFGGENEEIGKLVDSNNVLIAAWDKLIDKKREYISISYGAEGQAAADEAMQLSQKAQEKTRETALAYMNSGATWRSRSKGAEMQKNLEANYTARNQLMDILGTQQALDIVNDSRLNGLFDLPVEQLRRIQTEAPAFFAALDSEAQGYIEKIVSYDDQISDIKEQSDQALLGFAFDDLFSEFYDLITDMNATSEEFTDNFAQNLQNVVLQNLLADEFRSRIEALQKDIENSARGADGKFDKNKFTQNKDRLVSTYQQLAEEMEAERKAYAELLGTSAQDLEEQQAATRGGFETMSEDTASELNGRFTALQLNSEYLVASADLRNQSVLHISESLDTLTANLGGLPNLAEQTNALLAKSYLELVGINQNTAAVIAPIRSMTDDLAALKRNFLQE